MAYSFDFINRDGTIDHFQLGTFVSDGDALREARQALMTSTTAVSVEVWRGADRIGRVEEPDMPRRPPVSV